MKLDLRDRVPVVILAEWSSGSKRGLPLRRPVRLFFR
jgi:hypothetical protein